MAMI